MCSGVTDSGCVAPLAPICYCDSYMTSRIAQLVARHTTGGHCIMDWCLVYSRSVLCVFYVLIVQLLNYKSFWRGISSVASTVGLRQGSWRHVVIPGAADSGLQLQFSSAAGASLVNSPQYAIGIHIHCCISHVFTSRIAACTHSCACACVVNEEVANWGLRRHTDGCQESCESLYAAAYGN